MLPTPHETLVMRQLPEHGWRRWWIASWLGNARYTLEQDPALPDALREWRKRMAFAKQQVHIGMPAPLPLAT